MEMNLIKGYVGSEIHETNINQEEIKMGENVQTNVEAIIGKLEKSFEVFNNCKIGDSIDFEKLQINIPVLEYQGKKHQEKDWYVFRLSETLVKNGKVYSIRRNLIRILSENIIIEIDLDFYKKKIEEIKVSSESFTEALLRLENGNIFFNKDFGIIALSLGNPENNINHSPSEESYFMDLGQTNEMIELYIAHQLSLNLTLKELKKHFRDYYEKLLQLCKESNNDQIAYTITPAVLRFVSNDDAEYKNQDIYGYGIDLEIIEHIINNYSNEECKYNELQAEVINSLKPGDVISERYFEHFTQMPASVYSITEISDFKAETGEINLKIIEERPGYCGTVIKNDEKEFIAITDTYQTILHFCKEKDGSIQKIRGYRLADYIYKKSDGSEKRFNNNYHIFKKISENIETVYSEPYFGSDIREMMTVLRSMTVEELKNEKIIDFDFISLGEQLDAIKKFEGSVKIDKVEETSLYDIYQNLKLKNLI